MGKEAKLIIDNLKAEKYRNAADLSDVQIVSTELVKSYCTS